ncbi:MAG: hypothetical protein ACI8W3_001283 [Myxococcota bacterium]|jgi:hypothetical protein
MNWGLLPGEATHWIQTWESSFETLRSWATFSV